MSGTAWQNEVLSRIHPAPAKIIMAPCGKPHRARGANNKPCVFPHPRPRFTQKTPFKSLRGLAPIRDSPSNTLFNDRPNTQYTNYVTRHSDAWNGFCSAIITPHFSRASTLYVGCGHLLHGEVDFDVNLCVFVHLLGIQAAKTPLTRSGVRVDTVNKVCGVDTIVFDTVCSFSPTHNSMLAHCR